MRRKYLFLAVAVVLAAGGFWLTRSSSPAEDVTSQASITDVDSRMPRSNNEQVNVDVNRRMNSGRSDSNAIPTMGNAGNPQDRGEMGNSQMRLTPPVPNKRFTDFTPEQRVEFARKGHGPGG